MGKRSEGQNQTFHLAFEVLADKGKPSERVGRKATDLRIVFSNECLVLSSTKNYKLSPTNSSGTKHYYGGWVAEVGFQSLLNKYNRGASPCGWIQKPQGDKNAYLLYFTERSSP